MVDAKHRSRVATIVFTDLVDSTEVQTRIGDPKTIALLAPHRTFVAERSAEMRGRVIQWTGDGCLLTFETPSEAVVFSLNLLNFHHTAEELPAVRIGMHMGEVMLYETSNLPAGSSEISGLAVSLASRIESLAGPCQLLMSSAVFSSARQHVIEEDVGTAPVWLTHGLYALNGYDHAVEICEAGIEGISPFESPKDNEKAKRVNLPGDEVLLGWRPAAGLAIPGRQDWVLVEKVGDGPTGEVWTAQERHSENVHVFKFCFDAERLRILKQESNLFRTLQDVLGNRADIVTLHRASLDSPPYFLEMDYAPAGNLAKWADMQGGLQRIPMESRLKRVTQIADALGAAHTAGVVHRNIKPSNVLIEQTNGAGTQSILTDFGISHLLDQASRAAAGLAHDQFTEPASDVLSEEILRKRRLLYVAPEVLAGNPPTAKSDVYALGVLLYQIAVGDFDKPLAHGWERGIQDEQLKKDIAACIDGDPERRLANADELANRLHAYLQQPATSNALTGNNGNPGRN